MEDNLNIKAQSILESFIRYSNNIKKKIEEKKMEESKLLVSEIQEFIDEQITPFLYNELQEVIQQEIENVKFGLGLISYMQLVAEWTKDWGKAIYTFYLGKKQDWEDHIKRVAADETLDDINNKLQSGAVYLERIFSEESFTAKILRKDDEAKTDVNGIFLYGKVRPKRSEGWEGKDENQKFIRLYPWALIQEENFPLLYIGIFEGENPIGFLQLQIPGWGKEENGRNSILLKRLLFFINFLMREILMFLKQQLLAIENRQELNTIFNDKFIKNVCSKEIIDNSGPEIKANLIEFKSYYDTGLCSPDHLALKSISAFWKKHEVLKYTDLHKLNEAESILYWAPNYRDHLIHSFKVFLLGNYLINTLRNHKNGNDFIGIVKNSLGLTELNAACYEKFQELWMLTASFHDFCMPVQKFSEVQKEQFKKFLGVEKLNPMEKIEGRIFLTEAIIREEMIFSLFHILYYYKEQSHLKEELNALFSETKNEILRPDIGQSRRLRSLTRLGMFDHDILVHFITKGDHGISSAIRFMIDYMKVENNNKALKDNFKAYFKVMEAIFIHNFFYEKRNDNQSFCGNINFDDNPLAFILVLCDTIQDWGREELPVLIKSDENDNKLYSYKRPFGQINPIPKAGNKLHSFDDNNERLNLEIEYFYDYIKQCGEKREREICEIGTGKCNETVKEICTRNLHDIPCKDKDKGTCEYIEKIKDRYENLQTQLKVVSPLPTIRIEIKIGGETNKLQWNIVRK